MNGNSRIMTNGNSRITTTRREFMAASALAVCSLASIKAFAQGTTAANSSPYVDLGYPTRVHWGETHLHTSFSPDAGLVGDRLGPDEAYRFARGEQLRSSSGQLVRLERPYDWLVVSDHAEYLGLPQAFTDPNSPILNTPSGKKWAEALKQGVRRATSRLLS